jgi:dolichyl-phosphate-mannose--protein O-mannosyl transferase
MRIRCKLSISGLFPCVGYTFLEPRHVSVIQEHLQRIHHKCKVVPVLNYLIKYLAMKAYVGVEVQLHHSSPQHWMEVSCKLHAPAA